MADPLPRRRPGTVRSSSGDRARRYAGWIRRYRWLVIAAWLVLIAAVTVAAPFLGAGGDQLASVIPLDSPAIRVELRSMSAFGFPLSSRTVVVQRDPGGLSVYTQAESVLDALSIDQHPQPYPLLGAIPITNTRPLFPATGEQGTAVLTYLFMDPSSSLPRQHAAAQRYIDTFLNQPGDHVIGVAGSVPARAEQARLITRWMPVLDLATVAAVVLLVAMNFRSAVAPLVALAGAGMAFLLTLRIAGLVGVLLGIAVPAELEPLLVALLLGIVTDYTIFYVSALAARRRAGDGWDEAVVEAVGSFTPIIIAAGITVAAGTAALLAARSNFFRGFGPPMALSVLIGVLVSITFVPALLAVLGRWVFWPSRPRREATPDIAHGRRWSALADRATGTTTIDYLTRRRVAAAVLVVCVAGLVIASLPLVHLRLGVGFTQSLPSGDPVSVASRDAATAFAPGITSPTTLLLEGRNVAGELDALIRLQHLVAVQPGVAAVLGPEQNLARRQLGVVMAKDGQAARMLIVFDHDPLEATAITDVGRLRNALPGLLHASGLHGVQASLAGDTALADDLVSQTGRDLARIALAALMVNLLLLVIFLRALIAPLYLLASGVLALTASLGAVTWVFQDLLGHEGLTFYVPFAAAVLLVSLGSDYNIFGVGYVWEEARHRPLLEAVRVAVPQSTRAILAAGITLAVSFGLLVVIPLRAFQELALTMTVGIAVDAFVVRSLLMPSLLTLVGYASGWPGPHLREARRTEIERRQARRRPRQRPEDLVAAMRRRWRLPDRPLTAVTRRPLRRRTAEPSDPPPEESASPPESTGR